MDDQIAEGGLAEHDEVMEEASEDEENQSSNAISNQLMDGDDNDSSSMKGDDASR